MTITNETKNSLSLTNKAKPDLTWDDMDITWDDVPGTWDNNFVVIGNETKNNLSLTNQTKN